VSFADLPDRAGTAAETAKGASQLFDTLLLTSSIAAFLLATAVGVLVLVVVAQMARGADARGLAVLMIACGLGAVGLGLVAYESGQWASAFGAYAIASPATRGAIVTATSDAMKPLATAALLVAMAIPVALVPPTGRARFAIAFVALLVGGLAVGASAVAYGQKARVEAVTTISDGT
jgi:hypothetical protein